MAKPTRNQLSNNQFKAHYDNEIAAKQKEINELATTLAATKRAFEEHIEKERCRREAAMTGGDGNEINGSVRIANNTSHPQIEQLSLNTARKVSCNHYVVQTLYSEMKFMTDETFTVSPKILQEAMEKMGVKDEKEQLQLSEATRKAIKYYVSQKRSYPKKQIKKKYTGKAW